LKALNISGGLDVDVNDELLPTGADPAGGGAFSRLPAVPAGRGYGVYRHHAAIFAGHRGLPYLLFAGGFLLWMRGRSGREARNGILLSPLVYAVVMMACLAAWMAALGMFHGGLAMIGLAGAYSLLFGYGYVALAEVGRVLLRPDSESAPAL
jgi:hypothetical protein